MRPFSGYQYFNVASPSSVRATDHGARRGRTLSADNDVVAVGDLGLDHRIAGDFQREQIRAIEEVVEVNPLVLLKRQAGHARGNSSGQGKTRRLAERVPVNSIARDLLGLRRISPFFSSAFKWHITPLGELMLNRSPISRTVGP